MAWHWWAWPLAVVLIAACDHSDVELLPLPVINGQDDRRDGTHPAAVALMWAHRLRFEGSGVALRAPSLAAAFGVCEDEPFATQPVAAYCSGTIVGANVVITAAHCLGSGADAARDRCRRTWIVRGFSQAQGALGIQSDDVFACADVAAFDGAADVAVILLDRAVEPPDAIVRPSPTVPATGDRLVVWSHSSGLPLKVDRHAIFTDAPPDRTTFTAASDTFEGSSGGFALDAHGELVGMVLRGGSDWILEGTCQRAARTVAPAEEFLRADHIVRTLQAAPAAAPQRSTCGDGVCARDERTACDVDCNAHGHVPAAWLDDPAGWRAPASASAPSCSMRRDSNTSSWFGVLAIVPWVLRRAQRRSRRSTGLG